MTSSPHRGALTYHHEQCVLHMHAKAPRDPACGSMLHHRDGGVVYFSKLLANETGTRSVAYPQFDESK